MAAAAAVVVVGCNRSRYQLSASPLRKTSMNHKRFIEVNLLSLFKGVKANAINNFFMQANLLWEKL